MHATAEIDGQRRSWADCPENRKAEWLKQGREQVRRVPAVVCDAVRTAYHAEIEALKKNENGPAETVLAETASAG
jgi:hypothetical protein